MESKTYLKNIKISAKKLRFLLSEIKKLKPIEALDYLLYTPNKSARVFYKSIKSAISNAKNVLKVNEDLLKFKFITVEEGRKLKRFRHGGRGTMKPIIKRFSHIKVILEAEQPKVEKIVQPEGLEVRAEVKNREKSK
ncbi:50S ribosomal protein L22 [Candidatus Roizmanbacteria bacterium]|nr:50S ribosomal protein L22 [Candidatus Roizmanbacteria bacterium]